MVTNIFLRHLLQDHADQSSRATAFLARVEHGAQKARTADTVVFEAVFTLQKVYKQPRDKIRDALLPLLELPGMLLPGKRRFRKVFSHYVDRNVPFADAYHAVLAEELSTAAVMSFDRDFDRIPGVQRIEP